MHDGDAKFQFIQGLQYDARLQVMLSEPTTLLDAYRMAECFEMAQQSSRSINKQDSFLVSSSNNTGQNTSRDLVSMDSYTMDNIMTKHHEIQQQLNHPKSYHRHPRNNNNNSRIIVCFYCNNPGHVKKNCRRRLAAIKELDKKIKRC